MLNRLLIYLAEALYTCKMLHIEEKQQAIAKNVYKTGSINLFTCFNLQVLQITPNESNSESWTLLDQIYHTEPRMVTLGIYENVL